MERAIVIATVGLAACKGGARSAAPPPEPVAIVDARAVDDDAALATAPTAPPDAALDAPAVDDSAAMTPTPPGVARVVILHPEPLLPSEQKATDRIAKQLARSTPAGAIVDGVPAEAALVEAWTAAAPPGPPPVLPTAWATAPLVIVVQQRPPRVERGKRYGDGLGAIVAWRPPQLEPIYVEHITLSAHGSLSALADEETSLPTLVTLLTATSEAP